MPNKKSRRKQTQKSKKRQIREEEEARKYNNAVNSILTESDIDRICTRVMEDHTPPLDDSQR